MKNNDFNSRKKRSKRSHFKSDQQLFDHVIKAKVHGVPLITFPALRSSLQRKQHRAK